MQLAGPWKVLLHLKARFPLLSFSPNPKQERCEKQTEESKYSGFSTVLTQGFAWVWEVIQGGGHILMGTTDTLLGPAGLVLHKLALLWDVKCYEFLELSLPAPHSLHMQIEIPPGNSGEGTQQSFESHHQS